MITNIYAHRQKTSGWQWQSFARDLRQRNWKSPHWLKQLRQRIWFKYEERCWCINALVAFILD
ncbi:hypothetical protein F4Z99_09375 [Candidatus Poribacteria bacterium]|nr:hypothetical protein [Candidatus Poribacteria bacterium]MYB01678.1 hypothetical protein [Candidatus Poribacteria bacterium]